jgi:argininosuccinate lyase
MRRLWDQGEPLDEKILRYTAGEDHILDERLVEYDVRASIAHANMLHRQRLLSKVDLKALINGLTELAKSHAEGQWEIELEDEDVHTALEKRLTHKIGEAGKRIHLGRSRNDQVLAAVRLYLLDAADTMEESADAVADALESIGQREADTPLPGYTHMQQAMPSSVHEWANGFAAELRDDARGIAASRRRLSKNPLGSAAGYGAPGLPIDRDATRDELGFDIVHEPVTAVQLSRGKAEAGFVFELCMLMQDLGRLASDLLLFNTQEYSFVKLPNSMTTGSSIMPQKRNPDVLELVRSATATMLGSLTEIMSIPSKLGSGYQRDLQRIKAPLFHAIDLASDSADIMTHLIGGLEFIQENIILDSSIYAAGRANRIVLEEGLSFREAYQRVADELKTDEEDDPEIDD